MGSTLAGRNSAPGRFLETWRFGAVPEALAWDSLMQRPDSDDSPV